MNLNEIFTLRANFKDENLAKASWLIKLRWLIILFESLGIFLLAVMGGVSLVHYPYYLLTIIALVIFNTTSSILIKDRNSISMNFLLGQITFDLIQIFVVLLLISAHRNPLIELLYLYLVLIVFVLPFLWNTFFFVIILAISAYFYLFFHHDHHNVEHFYSHLFTMLLLWGVLNWLMSILNKYQSTLKQIQENQSRMDRLKSIGAMSSGICHELATPLNTVKLKLNKINRKQSFIPEDIGTSLEAIAQCEDAIKKLANSVSNLETHLEKEIDIDHVLLEIQREYPDFEFKIEKSTNQKIIINEVLFYQTLIDLIDNATEASTDKKIEINLFEKEHQVFLEIINSGPPFSSMVMNKLGEPFLTTKENGTGLGLFNAYNFMLSKGSMKLINLDNKVKVSLRFNI